MSALVDAIADRADLRRQVEGELESLFARHTAAAEAHGTDFAHLWALIARHASGGKLIRPVLLLETFDALVADGHAGPREEAVRIAAAVEALHCAFLLHDDVIDGDMRRRGRPNLIGELAAPASAGSEGRRRRHFARSAGILAGDLMLAAAHQLFARADLPSATRLRLLDLLERTVQETTAGELEDVGLSDAVVTPDLPSVLAMTSRKTASYTFRLPLRSAVILAGGSTSLEETMSTAGGRLGLAYQLQDDLLSTFGDSARHGKDPYSDLREGKQTAIICFARMTSAWPAIEDGFGDPGLTDRRAEEIRERLRDCGAERFVADLVDEQLAALTEELARAAAEGLVAEPVRAVLLDLVARVEGRRS